MIQKKNTEPFFYVLPLGVEGGGKEDNLSAYLLTTGNSKNFIALDAGTLVSGLEKTTTIKSLKKLGIQATSPLTLAGTVLTKYIKAYVLSHPHLDHINGLVINSPLDTKKNILGLDSTIDYLRDFIFNDKIWPNFASEGINPLHQYHYQRLTIGQTYSIAETSMTVQAFLLNHGDGYPSTAFLIQSDKQYVLYLGDLGPDAIEQSEQTKKLWHTIAPLVRNKTLHGIFIECSFSDEQQDNQLYGHLTPAWLFQELNQLAAIVNPNKPKQALKNLPIIVTHIKPNLNELSPARIKITQQLRAHNELGVRLIIPRQGQLIPLGNK